LFGQYKATIDVKGRINFPAKLRDELGNSFIIAKTIDARCIKIYSDEDWQVLVERIKSMDSVKSAQIQRFLFAGAYDIAPDKQGRFVIPPPLREYAGIESEAVIVGLEGRAEIWSKANWDKNSEITNDELIQTAIELGL
jgi:MraZ protein